MENNHFVFHQGKKELISPKEGKEISSGMRILLLLITIVITGGLYVLGAYIFTLIWNGILVKYINIFNPFEFMDALWIFLILFGLNCIVDMMIWFKHYRGMYQKQM